MFFDIETHDWNEDPPQKRRDGQFGHAAWISTQNLEYSRIVQLAWRVQYPNGKFSPGHTCYVPAERGQDGVAISEQATAFHGITNEMTRGDKAVPRIDYALALFTRDLHVLQEKFGGRLVAHHLEFDAGIIKAELLRANMAEAVPVLEKLARAGCCTMETIADASRRWPTDKKKLLDSISWVQRPSLQASWQALFGIPRGLRWNPAQAHNADYDTIKLGQLFNAIAAVESEIERDRARTID
jgi:DNA polymerase III epsilon subunit-like protein